MEPDEAIDIAINDLRRKRTEIDHDMSVLEAAKRVLAARRKESAPAPTTTSLTDNFIAVERVKPDPTSKPADIAAAAVAALSNESVWVQLPQLRERIEAGGNIKIAGADPVSNLSTILSRHKAELKLVSDKRRGWALASRANGHEFDYSEAPQ